MSLSPKTTATFTVHCLVTSASRLLVVLAPVSHRYKGAYLPSLLFSYHTVSAIEKTKHPALLHKHHFAKRFDRAKSFH